MKKAMEIKINGRSMIVIREGEKAFAACDKHTGEKIAEFLKSSIEEYPIMRLMNRPRVIFEAAYRPIEDEMELEYRLIGMKGKIYSPKIVSEMKDIENIFFGVNNVINLFLMKERAVNLIKSL